MHNITTTKKIICLIESLASGGAERQMTYLATELKKAGYDVEVWTYYPSDFYLPILQENHVTYRYIPEATDKHKRILVLRRELRQANPEVVIAYLDAACMAACMIKAQGARFQLIVSERNTTQRLTLKERLKFACYRFADYIVPNSYTQGKFIEEHYHNLKNKVTVITNFVDTDQFVPQHIETNDPAPRIMVVGRIMPQKNPLMLMKAVKQLQDKGIDIHVNWYGSAINNDYHQQCINMVKDLQIESSFHFVVPTQNIAQEYPKHDIFCLPSIYEGFSNVLCEAMSCQLPVVCSNVCDNPVIVADESNGFLFNPTDADDIALQLEKMISLPVAQRKQIGANNRKRIQQTFSRQTFSQRYISLIDPQSL